LRKRGARPEADATVGDRQVFMRLIDLSHPLVDGGLAFPGDPALSVADSARIATHRCNVSRIVMGTHQGTHLDAMSHVFDDGRTVDRMPLEWFYGPARVLRIPTPPGGQITTADLRAHEAHLTPDARVILDTGWYRHYGSDRFFEGFPSLTLDAAGYLASRRIGLLGMDMPSPGKQWLELHRVLLARDVEIVLVEALTNLHSIPDEFTFIGFPLNFAGRDGSPIRAVALCD
jgi:kynurenine formamidase